MAVRYERPSIVRRERIGSLLATVAQSDQKKPDAQASDVRLKENVQPVTWGDEVVEYDRPEITTREPLDGLLQQPPSDLPPDAISDVHRKENVQPVAWGGEVVEYERPEINCREPLVGRLGLLSEGPPG